MEKQAATVAELGLTALKEHDAQRVFEAAVEAVAQTLGDDLCKILELLPDERALLLRAGVGWAPGLVGHGTVSAGLESQAGYTLMQGRPIIVEDLRTETRFNGPPLLHNHDVVSGLSTPIYTSRGPWGVIGTHNRSHRPYSRQDRDFLVSVAHILGAAIERERYEKELHAAKQRLQDMDHLRGRFLHNVAHGLRTPLTPIVMQLDGLHHILERGDVDPQILAEAIGTARRGARRLQRLVDDLVAVTELQAQLPLRRERVDLAGLVQEAVQDYEAYAERRGVHLAVDARKAVVEGDREKLLHVLGLLLDNAIKFTPEGGHVHVRARPEGDFAAVHVEDTGIGMLDVDVLFQPLGQADEVESGLGFGLFMAREIVERHGGRIGAESPGPDKGSTFWFRIRLVEGERMTERVRV